MLPVPDAKRQYSLLWSTAATQSNNSVSVFLHSTNDKPVPPAKASWQCPPSLWFSGSDTIHTQRQGLQQQHLQQQQANTTALPRDKSWSPTCHPLHNRAIEPPAIEPHSLSTGIVGIPPAGTADQPPRGWGGRGLSASPPHNLPRVCYTHAPGRATWQKR